MVIGLHREEHATDGVHADQTARGFAGCVEIVYVSRIAISHQCLQLLRSRYPPRIYAVGHHLQPGQFPPAGSEFRAVVSRRRDQQLVELSHQAERMFRINDQRQVQIVCRLRNHVNMTILEHIECRRKPSQDRPDRVSNQADRHATVVNAHLAQLPEVVQKSRQAVSVQMGWKLRIQADSNRGLGSGNQVDGKSMTLEYRERIRQESRLPPHGWIFHADQSDVLAADHSLNLGFFTGRPVPDAGTGLIRADRIPDMNRHIVPLCRLNAGWVQYLCAHRSQFLRLAVTEPA